MLRIHLLILIIFISNFNAEIRIRPASWADKVIGSDLENFYKVDSKLFRSEQPSSDEMKKIEKFGIAQVLSLRYFHDDTDEAEDTRLKLDRIKLKASKVTQADVIKALKIIKDSKGPILVHCWHGSDRTGVIVASYRIVFQNWTKEKAIDEMENGGYGYHSTIYPNLTKLINSLDIPLIKNELQIK